MFTRDGNFYNCCCCDYLAAHTSSGGSAAISMVTMGCVGCTELFCPFHVQIFVAQRGKKCVPDGVYTLKGSDGLGTQNRGTVTVSDGVITDCEDQWNNGHGGPISRTPPLLVDWIGDSEGSLGTQSSSFFWDGHTEWGTWTFDLTFLAPGSGCTCCPKTCGDCTPGNASIGITMG